MCTVKLTVDVQPFLWVMRFFESFSFHLILSVLLSSAQGLAMTSPSSNGTLNIEVTRSASGHSTEVLSHVLVGFGSVFSS